MRKYKQSLKNISGLIQKPILSLRATVGSVAISVFSKRLLRHFIPRNDLFVSTILFLILSIILFFTLSCSTIIGVLGAIESKKQKDSIESQKAENIKIEGPVNIRGKVTNSANVPLENITVTVSWGVISKSDKTTKSGAYLIKDVPVTEVTISADGNGYAEYTDKFQIKEKEVTKDIILTPLPVSNKENQAPIIKALNVEPLTIKKGENAEIKVNAYDHEGNVLNYKWEASGGVLSSDTGDKTNWIGTTEGVYEIQVNVTDNKNATTIGTVNILVDAEGKGTVRTVFIASPPPSTPPQISPSTELSPIPTPTITPQPTPYFTSTPIPTLSSTPKPTMTPTPNSTPTVIPTSSPINLTNLTGKIAFMSYRDGNGEIYVMNADGTNHIRLTNNAAEDYCPVWSPDGTKIAFMSLRDGNQEIYVMNADGTNQMNLTNNPALDRDPTWSPDGSKIVFTSNRDGNYEIYVMNADGTNQIRLTNNTAYDFYPSWSPDGSKIVFGSGRDGNYEIYIMNADGTNQINITNNPDDDYPPNWSPDGTKIVFTSNRDGNYEIYVMNADGTNQIRLTNNSENDLYPSWSPDGSKIVFMSARDGNYEIYVMNTDGTNQIRLTNNPSYDGYPSWSR